MKTNTAANINVDESANVTLICEASGIPRPNITWKRVDGFPLPGGGFQHIVSCPKVKKFLANF